MVATGSKVIFYQKFKEYIHALFNTSGRNSKHPHLRIILSVYQCYLVLVLVATV